MNDRSPVMVQSGWQQGSKSCCWLFLCVVIASHGVCVFGQEGGQPPELRESRSDESALAAVFNEQHVSESGMFICAQAAQLPADQGYQLLFDWVIPGGGGRGFRVTTDFAAASHSTDPAAFGNAPRQAAIVSPAGMLVDLAKQLNKTDSLRQSVQQSAIGSQRDLCDQTVLLSILAMSENDRRETTRQLDELFKLFVTDTELLDDARQGILLCLDRAADDPTLHEAIREPIAAIKQQYLTLYDRKAWHRHLWALSAQTMPAADRPTIDVNTGPQDDGSDRLEWIPVTRVTAFEHGNAFPLPQWQLARGTARIQASYGDDFLFYQSPLQGDFEIECQATGFGYREAQLMVGGQWVGLVYDHQRYMVGNIRGELYRKEFGFSLTDTHRHGMIQMRASRHGQLATWWVNGCKAFDQQLPESACPWVAIRSNYRVHGGVDDLRITGSPTVPDAISLVESPDLLGWYDYYQDPDDSALQLSRWRARITRDGTGDVSAEISAQKSADLPADSHSERLLVYARPMIENGVIEYQFFYSPADDRAAKTIAHPALGRTCFLLRSDGVREHELTDGRFERSSIRPDNFRPLSDPVSQSLPLKANQWNDMRLVRADDTLTLWLNGQAIHACPFPSDEFQPSFGLFHFADQSDLRVRKLRWTGDWPKQLPPVKDQLLSGEVLDRLAWTASEPAQTMSHTFDESSIDNGAIAVVQGDPAVTLQPTGDGLIVHQVSETGYRGTLVAPVIQLGGDFDIIASYDQFQCESALEKIGSVRMHVAADSSNKDLALIQRVEDRSNDQQIQCLRMSSVDGKDRRFYFGRQPHDANAGRLRLSRRGSTIYYLSANNDSRYFRLIGQEEYVTDDLQTLGVNLGVQAQGPGGKASVRFRELEIRAERLSGPASVDRSQLLADLNKQRSELPESFSIDFSKSPPDKQLFYRWADTRPWDPAAGGLEIQAPGAPTWTSAGISHRNLYTGDFDITFAFEPIELPTPENGKHTQIYLQIELANEESTQFSAVLTKSSNGALSTQSQVRTRVDGEYDYSSAGSHPISDPDYLRVLRRGSDVFFLAGREQDQSEFLVGMASASDDPIVFSGVRLLLHTGGPNRTSTMLIKSLSIRAEGKSELSETTLVQPPPVAVPPKSIPNRVYDALRNLFQ